MAKKTIDPKYQYLVKEKPALVGGNLYGNQTVSSNILNPKGTQGNGYGIKLGNTPTGYVDSGISGIKVPVHNTPTPKSNVTVTSGANNIYPQQVVIPKSTQTTTTRKNSADNIVQNAYDAITGARTAYGASLGLPDMLGGKPVESNPPADSGAGLSQSFGYTQSPEDKASNAAMADYLKVLNESVNQSINPDEIYNQNLGRFQGQIDALNKVYNDQLNKARIEGAGRIESRKFSQGRSGQIGSGTGEAGVNAVQDANTEVYQSIDNQRNAAIQSVLSMVRNSAAEELKAKTEAKRSGAEALLKFYDEAPARKEKKLNPIISQLVELGIDPENLSLQELNDIAAGTGASVSEIKANYKSTLTKTTDAKAKTDLEKKKLTAEVDNLVNKHDWDTAKEALDRALEQKRIDVSWYNAETSRMNATKDLADNDPLNGKDPSYAGETLPLGNDSKKGQIKGQEIVKELEGLGVTTEAIIKIQAKLNEGYSLKQIAQAVDMPADVYAAIDKYIEIN